MTDLVYRKIRELCTCGLHPRGPVPVIILVRDLNISAARMRILLAQLIDQRLVSYQDPGKQYIRLTLLGAMQSAKSNAT